jgi:hypothetical protein
MKTSRTIKFNQSTPPKILDADDGHGVWRVEGREKPYYWVTRSKDKHTFYCACRSRRRALLCRHVQAVILRLAEQKHVTEVAFWTHLYDAERQHRRMAEFRAKSTSFWVTYNYPEDIPREAGSRILKLTTDVYGNVDAWYRTRDGREWRQMARRAA